MRNKHNLNYEFVSTLNYNFQVGVGDKASLHTKSRTIHHKFYLHCVDIGYIFRMIYITPVNPYV